MTPHSIPLSTPASSAKVSPFGAELRALRLGSIDLIRSPDSSWEATSPVLFPIVGWARDGVVRVGGETYPMGVHGFAAAYEFTPIQVAPDHARFLLRDDPSTRAAYPFAFELALDYCLAGETLGVELAVTNTGGEPMPYACGLHPGFRWPFAGGAPEDYRIVFDAAERPAVPVIAPGGLFTAETRAVALEGRVLPLTAELLAREALCFLDAASRGLTFEKIGGPGLRIEVDEFPHLALWSRPPSPFLSIEAWTGHGDPVGFEGTLFDKPSMRVLAPGERATHTMRISVIPAPLPLSRPDTLGARRAVRGRAARRHRARGSAR